MENGRLLANKDTINNNATVATPVNAAILKNLRRRILRVRLAARRWDGVIFFDGDSVVMRSHVLRVKSDLRRRIIDLFC